MCNAFPTIVNCEFAYFGATGGLDEGSNICIMSQNIMNQTIYLVLWIWFLVLATVASCMLMYRVILLFDRCFQYFRPQSRHSFRRETIQLYTRSSSTKDVGVIWDTKFGQRKTKFKDNIGHWFVLTQIARNADPYKFRTFLKELNRTPRVNHETPNGQGMELQNVHSN